ncbi:hypothetical protein F5884DRAFT_849235 [Xylogone sp. PMI_703]|nr:hypothetical protein F5884DRAFT_849235 [Xylogone sp. PMI_703]
MARQIQRRKIQLQFLQEALGLPTIKHTPTLASNQSLDIIFVCIDFEGGTQITSHAKSGSMGKQKRAQAGISIFDTRILSSTLPQETLRTYNIGLGGSPSFKRRIDRRFLFGETTWIPQLSNLLDSIEKLVDRTRNIILVGHCLPSDLPVLRALGFDLETSVINILDTEVMAQAILGLPGCRLKSLLEKLNCPVERCHVAGNDADFTLRALLLLVAEHYSKFEGSLDDISRERLERIEAIGRCPIPGLSLHCYNQGLKVRDHFTTSSATHQNLQNTPHFQITTTF